MSEANGVFAALAAAQGKFPAIAKTHTATVSSEKDGKWTKYSYNYADLSDIMSAIRPVLAECSLAVTQPIELRENGTLILRTSILHSDGSAIHSMLPLPAPTGKPQAFGSALTYMRRYALSSLLGIASEEDDDGSAAEQPGHVEHAPRQTRQPQKPAPAPQPPARTASPQDEVERALGAKITPINRPTEDTDPWRLGAAPAEDVADLMIDEIAARPWHEVQAAVKLYDGRLTLTEHEMGRVKQAMRERREAEKQANLLAAG